MRQESAEVCPLVYTKNLANPPMRETEGRMTMRSQKTKNRRGRYVFALRTTTFTKYSRIFGQEVQTSRSAQPTMMPSIHHEVLTIHPAGHPSRSTHVLLLLLLFVVVETSITKYTRMSSVHLSRSTQPCLAVSCPSITKYSRVVVVVVVVVKSIHHEVLTWMYSDVGYWWYKFPFEVQFTQSPRST